MFNIAIFASGSGSNAENITTYFRKDKAAKIQLFLTNKPDAPVVDRAKRLGIPCVTFTKGDFYESEKILNTLKDYDIDLIVLAGFLWLVPGNLVAAYPRKIINIHPALLPKYGGKGMFGDNVHRAVIENGETESGITIHYVTAEYDKGDIIFQAKCPVTPADTPETLAAKVHELEYRYFPVVIAELLRGK